MKLPADSKERNKILALIAIGVIAVIYALFQLLVAPQLAAKKANLARAEELRAQIDEAKKLITRIPADMLRDRENLERIADLSDRYVLRPVLGNFLLEASEKIETVCRELGISAEPMREIGLSAIPSAPGASTNDLRLLRAYNARVTVECDYRTVVDLIRTLERDNPYLCVTSIMISGQPQKDPEKHVVSIDIQWPVWVDPEYPRKIRDRLQEDASGTGQKGDRRAAG